MEPYWATPPQPAPPPLSPAPVPYGRALATNLLSGLRLFFGSRSARDFVVSFDQLATLLILNVLVGGLLDWQRADAGAILQLDAIYAWGLWLGWCLLLCAVIARTLSAAAETRRVMVVAASIAPWAIVVLWGLDRTRDLGASEELLTILLIAILIMIGLQVVRAVHGRLAIRAVAVVLLGSLVIGRMDQYLYLDTHAWRAMSADHDEFSYRDWYAAESLLYNEPERIDEAVDALAPERPGVSDVYYIGFAGDGSQRVFRREALFGQDVFARRMGTGPRSLELINDDADRISFPLASMSGLHYSLQRLGEHMNRDEDLLVLLLTSHGSQEEGLAVSNGGLPLNAIEPDDVRRALDASGIEWRVIIVSACFAGTFIDALKTDRTLVITAADAEHSSFGCADDRELTYFGEAFLRDALPKASSLVGAFQAARKAIGEREREEELTPSNPQMYLGAAMRDKLAALGSLPLEAVK